MHNFNHSLSHDQTGWPNEKSVRLPFWEIWESEPRGFESWSSNMTLAVART